MCCEPIPSFSTLSYLSRPRLLKFHSNRVRRSESAPTAKMTAVPPVESRLKRQGTMRLSATSAFGVGYLLTQGSRSVAIYPCGMANAARDDQMI
jgi:hypothetical protein